MAEEFQKGIVQSPLDSSAKEEKVQQEKEVHLFEHITRYPLGHLLGFKVETGPGEKGKELSLKLQSPALNFALSGLRRQNPVGSNQKPQMDYA